MARPNVVDLDRVCAWIRFLQIVLGQATHQEVVKTIPLRFAGPPVSRLHT